MDNLTDGVFDCMDDTAKNEELLKCMGFMNELEVREALKMAKNDINEAISILTSDRLKMYGPPESFKSTDNDINFVSSSINNQSGHTDNEIVMSNDSDNSSNNSRNNIETSNNENLLIFPVDCLYKLENSVFVENWSIPYKKDEWLDRLMRSAIALIKEDLADQDPNCKKFITKVFPDVYFKLIDSLPVRRWTTDIHEGIYQMILLCLELIALRLNIPNWNPEINEALLGALYLIFNEDTSFHSKNSHRRWDESFYLEQLKSSDHIYSLTDQDRNGWLINFINHFGIHKGFEGLKTQMNLVDLYDLNLLFRPVGVCAEYLNGDMIKELYTEPILKIYEKVNSFDEDDYKCKNISKVFDLLFTVKKIIGRFWPEDLERFHALHLKLVLSMLKYPHFNSKMNSLKEICKMIDNSRKKISAQHLIKEESLSNWIVENRILSLAVEGNVDQSQYCEKIKTIVEFIGELITEEELSTLWSMQFNKSMSIVDNLYTIIGMAATRFNQEQLDYLIARVMDTWNDQSSKLHDRLVGLLRFIGRETRNNRVYTQVLEALWELKNRPDLSRDLLVLIYAEHLNVLVSGSSPRDQYKSIYLKKCAEDIKSKPGTSQAIASLRHIHDILNSYQKISNNKALKEVLEQSVQPLMKGLIASLHECQQKAFNKSIQLGRKFDHTVLVDEIFTHEEVVKATLTLIKFILQETNVYLNLSRAKEIWAVLIDNENACDWDRDVGYTWFIECWADLEENSRVDIFKNKILKVDPSKVNNVKGYECFKLYFIKVNLIESKLQETHISSLSSDTMYRLTENVIVDKLDLTGLEYLWSLILSCQNEKIAVQLAVKFLIEMSFERIGLRLRKEILHIHQRFIDQCFTRLEKCIQALEDGSKRHTTSSSGILAESIKAISMSGSHDETDTAEPRAIKLKKVERILITIERYIKTVEENVLANCRVQLPHYLTFKAETFPLQVQLEDKQFYSFELFACANETLGSLRSRVNSHLQMNIPSNCGNSSLFSNSNSVYQIYFPADKLLAPSNDHKFLFQLGINGMESLIVKSVNNGYSSTQTPIKDSLLSSINSSSMNHTMTNEQEKQLPSYLIASNQASFDLFGRVEETAESASIKAQVRKILNIIPTNPRLLEVLDSSLARISLNMNSSKSMGGASNLVKSPSTSNLTQGHSSIRFLSQSTPNTPTFLNYRPSSSRDHVKAPSSPGTAANSAISTAMQSVNLSAGTPAPSTTSLITRLANMESSGYSESWSVAMFRLFDKTSQPLNRILYNLEALSSRLMPSSIHDQLNSDAYQNDFLRSNGLALVVALLRLEPSNSPAGTNLNDYEAKQEIYLLLLQLLRLLFFGSVYPVNNTAAHISHKRPSSTEPNSSCSAKKPMIQSEGAAASYHHHHSVTSDDAAHTPQKSVNSVMSRAFAHQNLSITTQSLVNRIDASELKELMIQLLILYWSASAGNIELSPPSDESLNQEVMNTSTSSNSGSKKTDKEVKFFIPYEDQNKRLSTGSDTSISHHQGTLQPGVCLKKKSQISVKDVKIAYKSIELISCFLNYRKDCLQSLAKLKFFQDCLLDVLTGSISASIRTYTEQFLLKLYQIDASKEFLISLIIRARLPLWVNSSLTRSSSQRLITQSAQYFNLRCFILDYMTRAEQTQYGIDIGKMLSDEINWFNSFSPSTASSSSSSRTLDNCLLTGHLNLTKSLLTCETADKERIGDQLIEQLIRSYLFPASYVLAFPMESSLVNDGNGGSFGSQPSMNPICSEETSRVAAFNLLVELSRDSIKNYHHIKEKLVRLHHNSNRTLSSEWNVVPMVASKAECGFVGLKNAGATCYMNAVLQQLYMIPGICDFLLSIDDQQDCINRESSVFWQLQNVLAHLRESKLEYYVPEAFWRAFRMWGQEINVREQQDAFDFFISLTDQIDEYLKKIGHESVFKHVFEGTFSNQFICKDCPHSYEREEMFLGLNLPVKSGNLQESLAQFVKDELLDADNAYFCEKCNEKRSAIKRTCIKRIPKYMCIQLKRFDYDWESNRSLKFDDYFQFPRRLDVSPYTYDSLNKGRLGEHDMMDTATSTQAQETNYELVGVVVHSGQANAGHYYSFIKSNTPPTNKPGTVSLSQEIRELEQLNQSAESCTDLNNSINSMENIILNSMSPVETSEKWYKFNDTVVEEINLNDTTLMEECFGGTFVQQSTSEMKVLPDERVRYWSGYMLFYREVNFDINQLKQASTTTVSAKVNVKSSAKQTNKRKKEILASEAYSFSRDSLSELSELVSKGDEKGIFRYGMPPAIEQIVRSENLEFCKNRSIYDASYFKFIYNLIQIFREGHCGMLSVDAHHHHHIEKRKLSDEDKESLYVDACSLALEFLFNTYLKTGRKLRTTLNLVPVIKEIVENSRGASLTMVNYIVNRESNSNFIRHFLLECPASELRVWCADVLKHMLHCLIEIYNVNPCLEDILERNAGLKSFIASLVQLLDKAVIDLTRSSYEYFDLLCSYANMSKEATQQLISLGIFNKLFCFLLGNPGQIKQDDTHSRRWTISQLKDFGHPLFELISSLILKCDLFSLKTCGPDDKTADKSIDLIEVSEEDANMATASNDLDSEDNNMVTDRFSQPESTPKRDIKPPCRQLSLQGRKISFRRPSECDVHQLLPLPQEVQIYLYGALSAKYLKEVVLAIEHIEPTPLPKTCEMILTCCYCNETFSENILVQILTHISVSLSNEFKQGLMLLNDIILLEDPLQLSRLDLALNGNGNYANGLLNIIRINQQTDAKKSYHCVKFIVKLSNKSDACRDYLLKTANNWEWSVNWLKVKMSESAGSSSVSFMSWNNSSTSKFNSNEDSEIKTFQRTKSAQRTLDDATALLKSTELDL